MTERMGFWVCSLFGNIIVRNGLVGEGSGCGEKGLGMGEKEELYLGKLAAV